MGNILVTRKDHSNRRNEELPLDADVERGGLIDARASSSGSRPQWMKVLHRVPPQVRERKKNMYDPSVVSLGPYHHGQPQFRRFEEFKDEVVKVVLNSDDGAKDRRLLFRGKILERIDEIRSFYGGLSRDEYNDEALAEMMLRDACVILYYMELEEESKNRGEHSVQYIGASQIVLMDHDIIRLENQIPWWVIKLLISLTYDKKDEGEALICRYLSYKTFGDFASLKRVPWEEGTEQEPIHFLEALRNTHLNIDPLIIDELVSTEEMITSAINEVNEESTDTPKDLVNGRSSCPTFKCKGWSKKSSRGGGILELVKRPFRSVTELKAKGIYFKPSSGFLNDIRFSSYSFHGVLHLPILIIGSVSLVFFSNVMALEMSPGSPCSDLIVTSYLTFMNSLIENSKDVKELQEKGIIMSFLEDNEQIVRMFKEMDSYGLYNMFLHDVKMRMNEHCNSKVKTWIAELINTYFRTPWTAIALIAAIFLLCLTLLQTYYALKGTNSGK